MLFKNLWEALGRASDAALAKSSLKNFVFRLLLHSPFTIFATANIGCGSAKPI